MLLDTYLQWLYFFSKVFIQCFWQSRIACIILLHRGHLASALYTVEPSYISLSCSSDHDKKQNMQWNDFIWAISLITCAMWDVKWGSADFHKPNRNNSGLTKSLQRPDYDRKHPNRFLYGKCANLVFALISKVCGSCMTSACLHDFVTHWIRKLSFGVNVMKVSYQTKYSVTHSKLMDPDRFCYVKAQTKSIC